VYLLDSRKYWSDIHLPIQFEFRDPQTPFPLHTHDFHEIVLVYSGRAVHLTLEGDFEVQSGDVLSIKPGQVHGFKNIKNLVLMNILVKPSFFEDDLFGLHSPGAYDTLFKAGLEEDPEKSSIANFTLEYKTFTAAKNLIEAASEEMASRREGYRAMVAGLFLEFLISLVRSYGEHKNRRSGFGSDVNFLIDYVKKNYRSPLSMERLTEISGMSESRVLRVFKRHFGCSPFQYINRLRLEAAEDALIQTDKPITDIALDLGFNDSNYFARSFRKHLGTSPREYRDNYLRKNIL
jgi:AraC-like DNA-binding protein